MAEEKKIQETLGFKIDIKDLTVETYTKAFLAYRISLENWFLLNELLAYVKNEKLTSKEFQLRLSKLFEVVNGEILRELVKLDRSGNRKEEELIEEKGIKGNE